MSSVATNFFSCLGSLFLLATTCMADGSGESLFPSPYCNRCRHDFSPFSATSPPLTEDATGNPSPPETAERKKIGRRWGIGESGIIVGIDSSSFYLSELSDTGCQKRIDTRFIYSTAEAVSVAKCYIFQVKLVIAGTHGRDAQFVGINFLESLVSEFSPSTASAMGLPREFHDKCCTSLELDYLKENEGDLNGGVDAYFSEGSRNMVDESMAGLNITSLKLKEMYQVQMLALRGDPELGLIGSLDPFSEGVVFSVRPPKKSWKNIANLSGGEKVFYMLISK